MFKIKLIKKYTEPKKEFLAESKSLFLAGLKSEGIISDKNSAVISLMHGRALGYGLSLLLFFAIFSGGTVAFSQKDEIIPGNILYPIKRLGENIRVKIASPDKAPLLQDEFAQKRLEEIKQVKEIYETELEVLKERNEEDSEKIERKEMEVERKLENLNENFHSNINSILSKVDDDDADLCDSILEKIRRHGEIMSDNGDEKEYEEWDDFDEKCSSLINTDSGQVKGVQDSGDDSHEGIINDNSDPDNDDDDSNDDFKNENNIESNSESQNESGFQDVREQENSSGIDENDEDAREDAANQETEQNWDRDSDNDEQRESDGGRDDRDNDSDEDEDRNDDDKDGEDRNEDREEEND